MVAGSENERRHQNDNRGSHAEPSLHEKSRKQTQQSACPLVSLLQPT